MTEEGLLFPCPAPSLNLLLILIIILRLLSSLPISCAFSLHMETNASFLWVVPSRRLLKNTNKIQIMNIMASVSRLYLFNVLRLLGPPHLFSPNSCSCSPLVDHFYCLFANTWEQEERREMGGQWTIEIPRDS